jgi:hypothetical protein
MQQHIEELTTSLQQSQNIIQSQKLIEEWHTAQLVIQNLELTKMLQSLQAKEKKKKNDRTILFPGGFG